MRKRKLKEREVSRRDFLKKGASAGVGATALAGLGARDVEAQDFWDLSADVVTIGAGTAGLAAAISALDHGASVILLEENVDIGGHGMCSGGQVHLGGGTSNQLKRGVEDSADQVFLDWVRHDHGQSRYSDRDLVRAFADENAATFEFLIENGVEFQDHLTGPTGASTVPRQQRTVQWPIASERVTHHPTRVGSGLVRALEASARSKGAQVLLRHKMTSIVRESSSAGRVLGVTAVHEGRALNIAARKGLLVATGGSSTSLQQALNHGRASVLAGCPERRHPKIIRRVDLGPRANQQIRDLAIVPVARPMKSGGAIPSRCIDVGTLLKQPSDRRPIGTLRGVSKRRLGRRRDRDAHCQRREQKRVSADARHPRHRRPSPSTWHRRHPPRTVAHGAYTSDSVLISSIGKYPVLPPTPSKGRSNLSISVRRRLACEVPRS